MKVLDKNFYIDKNSWYFVNMKKKKLNYRIMSSYLITIPNYIKPDEI